MNKTLKIVLIILVGIVFIGSLLFLGYAFLFGKHKTNDNANLLANQDANTAQINNNANINTPVTNSNQNTNSPLNSNTNTAPVTYTLSEEEASVQLKSLATIYAEFYGSFSNQSNFQNIKTLYDYMTDSLKKQEEKTIAAAKKTEPVEFYSVTSSALAQKVTELDLSKKSATVVATCQRVEEKGEKREARKFYQDLTLKYVLEGNTWKVNSSEWGKEK